MIHEHEMKSAQQHILRPTLRFWLHKNVARLGLSLHFALYLSLLLGRPNTQHCEVRKMQPINWNFCCRDSSALAATVARVSGLSRHSFIPLWKWEIPTNTLQSLPTITKVKFDTRFRQQANQGQNSSLFLVFALNKF